MKNVVDPFEDDDAFFGSLSIEEFQNIDRSIANADSNPSLDDKNNCPANKDMSFRLVGENKILREHLSKVLGSFLITNSFMTKTTSFAFTQLALIKRMKLRKKS